MNVSRASECTHSSLLQTHNTFNCVTMALESLLTKNSSNKMLPPVRIEPGTSDSKSNTLLSELIWNVLLRGSLNFYSDTTVYLIFGHK